MFFDRRRLNILLILITVCLGGLAVWLATLPPPGAVVSDTVSLNRKNEISESLPEQVSIDVLTNPLSFDTVRTAQPSPSVKILPVPDSSSDIIRTTGFEDKDPEKMIGNHPFRKEALKILKNHLEESDSISRRKILSYCEHYRTAYTTKDIDFIRQVFSDNALIIVGNVVKTSRKWNGTEDTKVAYAMRSKQSYLSHLDEVFRNNKTIKVDFSEFKIMRHPSMKGIYGVSLRQKYATDRYSDDGYLFLLWDFRNPSMPQIHVRTWQPHRIVSEGDELIDISDFNLD